MTFKWSFAEGRHNIEFNANQLNSCVYFYRIVAEQILGEGEETLGEVYSKVKKMILIK